MLVYGDFIYALKIVEYEGINCSFIFIKLALKLMFTLYPLFSAALLIGIKKKPRKTSYPENEDPAIISVIKFYK